MTIDEAYLKCPICKKTDLGKNMVRASISDKAYIDEMGKQRTYSWQGRAHLECMKIYNKTHEPKYSINEYGDNKFLGKATPI